MKKILLTTLSILGLYLPLLAQEAESVAETSTGPTNLWGLLVQGGWAMYPLGLCSLAMLFLLFHCWRETKRPKYIPDSLLGPLSSQLSQRNLKEAKQALKASPTVLARSLLAALSRAQPEKADANKAIVENNLVESLEHEENAVNQWVNYLNVIAAIAPMIGLLGTVSGMISAFQTIGSGGMGKPELLAGDIGEALITTATGLVIGIPSMVGYFIMKNRLNNLMLATTQSASLMVDYLSGDVTDSLED